MGLYWVIALFSLGFVLYLKEMYDFYDDSIHKVRGRKHTLRISGISWFNAIDDIVLCMIKKKTTLRIFSAYIALSILHQQMI